MAGRTDMKRIDGECEIDRQERDDSDFHGIRPDWYKHAKLETGIPMPSSPQNKQSVTMRLDPEIVQFFRGQGRGWQTRVNAVLRAYVDSQPQR